MSNRPGSITPGSGWRWYGLALAILLVGYALAGVAGWRMIRLGSGLTLMRAPGEKALRLTPGSYTLYHEFEGVVDSKYYYHDLRPAELVIALMTADGAAGVTLESLTPQPVYRLGSRRGAALARFTIDRQGDFLLSARADAGASPPPTMLAIGDGRERRTMKLLQWALGLTLGTTALAGALALWAATRRANFSASDR